MSDNIKERIKILSGYTSIFLILSFNFAYSQTSPIDLAQLAQAYSSDPNSADIEFKGKRLSVEGMVEEIDSDHIVMIAPNVGRALAKFDSENSNDVSSIQPNQTIALSCIIDGTGFYMVEMSACHRVPLALSKNQIAMPNIQNSPDTDCEENQQCTDEQFKGVVSDLQNQWVLIPAEIRSQCISQTTYPTIMNCILNGTMTWLNAHPNDAAPWVNPPNPQSP